MAAAVSVLDAPKEIPRPVKGYRPSLWGDIFLSFSLDTQVQERYAEAVEQMKEEVRSMVMDKESNPKDKMSLIDILERLGVAYHFEQEIEDQIEQIFKFHAEDDKDIGDYDLFTTALHFRLFRQHGYDFPCSVFGKFKDKDNTFKKSLNNDIEGLLSLYEASYLRYHGEDILEEAMVFTTHCLTQARPHLASNYLQEKVTRALKHPTHRGVPKVEARYYISIYEKDESKNELLLRLAKFDFNLLQNLYKKELSDLFKWWKSLSLVSQLPYARERVVESYLWAVAFHFEPEYSFSRLAVAKSTLMIAFMNDTYDNYATLEELEIFTEAVQRWDIKEIDRLPNYMKILYKALLSTYEAYDHELSKQGRSYALSYATEAMKQLAGGYHKKAKWCMGHEMPTFQQHLAIGVIVSTCYVGSTSSFLGMESASEEAFDWLMKGPKIVEAAGMVGRYMNDIGSYEREYEAGQFPTAVDCYMKEHGMSKQETLDKFLEFSEDAWMTMNKEWINLRNCVPRHILKPVLNFARVTEVSYKNGEDGYTNPEKVLEPDIVALFISPIIV